MAMDKLLSMNSKPCPCGKDHRFSGDIAIGKGAVSQIPVFLSKYGAAKVFLLSDRNTWAAAGVQVAGVLEAAGLSYTSYCFPQETLEPDEKSVGSAVMHFDGSCQAIVAVGSGVLNDIGKLLSAMTGKPYLIVATAPSMDGYASASSSMTRNGLKISLPSRSADGIIGDTDILCRAPLHMMKAGLGDMLAKYVSICEWRISHVITGEYYCPEVAELIRKALNACIENAPGLLQREEKAVQAVFEGLVIGGIAMNYAGLSRPASGVEHYISHVLDMRAAEFGTPAELHGIQCAIGTRIAVTLYEKLKAISPNREKALAHAAAFDYEVWCGTLRDFLGKGAESMIALEAKEKKYDVQAHRRRLESILAHWNQLLQIIEEELPAPEELDRLLEAIDAPKTLGAIGIDPALLPTVFRATRDIRDKYVLSRLAWDLGITDALL